MLGCIAWGQPLLPMQCKRNNESLLRTNRTAHQKTSDCLWLLPTESITIRSQLSNSGHGAARATRRTCTFRARSRPGLPENFCSKKKALYAEASEKTWLLVYLQPGPRSASNQGLLALLALQRCLWISQQSYLVIRLINHRFRQSILYVSYICMASARARSRVNFY